MKKLQILTLALGIVTTSAMFAKLDQDGFSDITAKNPNDQDQSTNATAQRIKEEMGDPVTFASFQAFKEKVKMFITKLSSAQGKKSKADLKKAVRGVVDLFKASNKISDAKISSDVKNELVSMKNQLLSLNLPSRLKDVLNKRTK